MFVLMCANPVFKVEWIWFWYFLLSFLAMSNESDDIRVPYMAYNQTWSTKY